MVSGDVFRTPKEPLLLCVEVGSGVQICSSAFITLLFAALGEHAKQEPYVKQEIAGLRLSSNVSRHSQTGTVALCGHAAMLRVCIDDMVS